MAMAEMIERFKTWQSGEAAKQRAMRERLEHLAPLREELVRRLVMAALIILPFYAVLVVRQNISFMFAAGAIIWPAVSLIIAGVCLSLTGRRWSTQLAIAMVLQAVTFAAIWVQVGLARQGSAGFPQFGGILMLTILLCGLLIGEFFVGAWALICCVSLHSGGTGTVSLGWSAVYIACACLTAQFSRYLERFHDASRKAEEQQRSAIVAERTRFARDIHDTLAQGFTGIMMQLNAAEQRLDGDSETVRTHIERARELASSSLEEARRSVAALRAAAFGSGTLLDAIAQIGNNLISDSDIKMETRIDGQPYSLPENCENNLLRIAQEAITNAVRHAHAATIYIYLKYRTGSVVLEIGDSGLGMSGEEVSGFGVDGMRERARQIGGEIKILSDPGRGTRILVTVPNA